ncbi:GNAT family N-acetyltransferase [Marinilactibacillus sp. Marseille-P9653]|uniref:GNAT family N-acetyltransferase n=1 Tax=Marinilactibacillus sp. Marseille-P9653 TaxID=2866583 RepID=UPI001CE48B97|nr:GNAT family N-acetyltransferase [Marinilactibacillus sp. Marseille-P9653]
MKKVVYRVLEKGDIPSLVSILIKNWKFDQTLSEKNAYHMGTSFLNYELAKSSYTEVAEVDGEVVGMLASSFGKVPLSSRLYLLNVLVHGIPLLLSKEGRASLRIQREVLSNDQQLFDQLDETFEGEVTLFAVGEKAQGLGIGSGLFNRFLEQMKKRNLNHFFLYTDTNCNYGFYEHKGLDRIAEKTYSIKASTKFDMTSFIYSGKRTNLET